LNLQFRLFLKCLVVAGCYQSTIDAIERENRRGGDARCLIPIRCIPGEKITKEDRLLVGFDALVLSELNGKSPSWGKIIHGSRKRTAKVKLDKLRGDVEAMVKRLADQLSNKSAPALVLNKHCSECQFQLRCREQALAADDLSLLATMSPKERKKLHDKGIFTIKQLSYTFRPRRRKRTSTVDPDKYYHALKALAIREQKVHLAGAPTLDITSTPIFLDVEGVPDRDFYYLIGLRIRTGESCLQRQFWADGPANEESIWNAFLAALRDLPDPQIIHYGSYDAYFLKKMRQRYCVSKEQTAFIQNLVNRSVNLLSVLYARIYFPTYTNGLKEVASYVGYRWSGPIKSGLEALATRVHWETTADPELKTRLIDYNSHDCQALELITNYIAGLCRKANESPTDPDFVNTANLKRDGFFKFKKVDFLLPEFEQINRASYWNYQRERIFLRSGKSSKRPRPRTSDNRPRRLPINKIIECRRPRSCPKCKAREKIYKYGRLNKVVYDLKFGRSGVKRWIVKYLFNRYICWACRTTFVPQKRQWTGTKVGPDLMRYVVYQTIELQVPQGTVTRSINELFHVDVTRSAIKRLKTAAAQFYKGTYERIIKKIITGSLAHADETKINIGGKESYVWALTNQEEVAYFYTETREGERIRELLKSFKGVLVSDFYSVYDSIDCSQQKCLIHLIRDLNDGLSREPFNTQLKELCWTFAGVLKPIIHTVDARGLKARYLRKHKTSVERFFRWLDRVPFEDESTLKFRKRLEKNRKKLFTFLDHDQVPWNNNNAEHAIKTFATLRRVLGGKSSVSGIKEYLILLSVCETCKYKGVNFLNFLRSGSRNIDDYANGGSKETSPESH
jgi:predicted RecB family nuclease